MGKPVIISNFVCDTCKKIITNHEDGFHIQGNVYLADPNTGKGIFGGGNWLGKVERGDKIHFDEIPETVQCKTCLCKVLNIPLTLVRNNGL